MSTKDLYVDFNEFINDGAIVNCISKFVPVHDDERLTIKICVMSGMPLTLLWRVMECI